MMFEPDDLPGLNPFDAPHTPVFSVCDNFVSDFSAEEAVDDGVFAGQPSTRNRGTGRRES
jgi:hypothetical protein